MCSGHWYGLPRPRHAYHQQRTAPWSTRAGLRDDAATADLTGTLPEEVATMVKQAALYSMGVDITAADLQPIQECCTKLIAHTQEYRPTD